jgi:membrane protein YdbS with pleckstrin-like domain
MKERRGQSYWITLVVLLLVNVVEIAASAIYSHGIPVWVRVASFSLLGVATIFAIFDAWKQKRRRDPLGSTQNNGTV